MYDGTRFRAASRRICRDKYLDIICQFYVFVAFAAVAAAHTLHNFKFCDCINDSKFHAPTNVWTDTQIKKQSQRQRGECQNYNSIWNNFDRLINILCVCMSAFSLARSLVRLFVLFDIYHVNIQLHQSTHCRISMLQTWSLCFGHTYFQVNVNRRESEKSPMWCSIHRFSMWTQQSFFHQKVCDFHRDKFVPLAL